ncbi:MAG: hypothetical protein H7228_08265 [Polaromonas sp.]|nr:hypothetical protein [Polaromonas sp.]
MNFHEKTFIGQLLESNLDVGSHHLCAVEHSPKLYHAAMHKPFAPLTKVIYAADLCSQFAPTIQEGRLHSSLTAQSLSAEGKEDDQKAEKFS